MKKKQTSFSDSLPEGVFQHENGLFYKELTVNGIEEPLKIFNSRKPQRLEGETYQEYVIRRKFVKQQEKLKSQEVWYSAIAEGRKKFWKEVQSIHEMEDPKKQEEEFNKLNPGGIPLVKNK